jgi:signal transduction histidine kinase
VKDRGNGIPARDQANLFVPFFRASNVGTHPGTGLGLSIVKQAVDLHHGIVTVESQLGQGTQFVVQLPKHYQPENESM